MGAAPVSTPPLAVRVDTCFNDSRRDDWDASAIRLGGSIYMSYDWAKTWWQVYGRGRELRIFSFYSDAETVAILPIYIDTIGWGPLAFRVGRLVGANVPPKVFDPPVCAAFATEIVQVVLQMLLNNDNCDSVSLGPVSGSHCTVKSFASTFQTRPNLVSRSRVERLDVHSVFHLPGSMEEYFGGLPKNECKKRKYELRLLRKDREIKTDVITDPATLNEEFDRFVTQHTTQWNAEGKAGHFGAWPKALEFNKALVEAQGALGRVRFVRILADERVVSSQYIFDFGNTWYWELPSRAVGNGWDRLSLGPAGLLTTIDFAIREGKGRIEGGIGHYEYKVRLAAEEHAIVGLSAVSKRLPARLRFWLFKLLKVLLLYGYHKLWYRRILPHIPNSAGHSQWRFWLRLDI